MGGGCMKQDERVGRQSFSFFPIDLSTSLQEGEEQLKKEKEKILNEFRVKYMKREHRKKLMSKRMEELNQLQNKLKG